MAAFIRGVVCLVSTERHAFLTKKTCVIEESKRYVRGLRRKPVKVLFSENETGKVVRPPPESHQLAAKKSLKNHNEAELTSAAHHAVKSSPAKKRINVQSTAKLPEDMGSRDQVDGLLFEKASPGDKRLARLVSVARSRKFREQQGKILLEGKRLICDALDAGAKPQMVFFSTVDRLRELPLDKLKMATLVKVKFEDIKLWSDLVAPQGVIAIFSRPDPSRLNFANRSQSVPLSLICDNIRDPGNLGTMLRCAAAAACHNVLLTKGCVDAWEPKVLRAAMGAHFRLPIYPSVDWDDIENHLPKPVTVHVADSSCGPDRGRETEDNGTHNLTKAGAYGWVSSRSNPNKMLYEEYDSDPDSDSDSDSEHEAVSLPRVNIKLYHESWAKSPAALVVGGETHGLSLEAVQLAEKTDGYRLFIPVAPGVDSLNSAMAASILLFEGRKQLSQLQQGSGKKSKTKRQAS
ncbi:rRNA methyltransferase 3A, mitochondrial [Melanotaenia boesemani]|uniref:rRNA methyltransferase 3A, mitochondrial n=1 Tax=Melanotaenia boesemani TaxID=1250792 RepID=UPI001C05B562|nr:rRNA methyltransferase 3A, mitochondrial [Melanotaenia boesemani]